MEAIFIFFPVSFDNVWIISSSSLSFYQGEADGKKVWELHMLLRFWTLCGFKQNSDKVFIFYAFLIIPDIWFYFSLWLSIEVIFPENYYLHFLLYFACKGSEFHLLFFVLSLSTVQIFINCSQSISFICLEDVSITCKLCYIKICLLSRSFRIS